MSDIKDINKHFTYYTEGCAEDAEVLVMVPGVSCGVELFTEGLSLFLPKYKVLCYNNPGVGGTSIPLIFNVDVIAKRVLAVLDYLNIRKAHFLGHSMGGFTVQRIALMAPEYVDKLVLVSTSYGGPHTQTHAVDTADLIKSWVSSLEVRDFKTAKEALTSSLDIYKHIFGKSFVEKNPEDFEKWAKHLMDIEADYLTTLRHFGCGSLFSSYGEVHNIQSQTLVVHGEEDKLVYPTGGELLAKQIPNSTLLRLPECGHLPMYEVPHFYPKVKAFLQGEKIGEVLLKDKPGTPINCFDHSMRVYATGLRQLFNF